MPSFAKRLVYIALGLITTLLGIIGVWVPGLPTTVFILIALWAFSTSSPRLHAWLTRLPILKQALKEVNRFQTEGTIDNRVKFISQACSWISFIAVSLTFRSVVFSSVVGLLALSCSVFMYLVPSTQAHTSCDK